MPSQHRFLFEDTFTEDDWKESIQLGQTRSDNFSRSAAASQLTIVCPFAKVKAAQRFILGYSWVDSNGFLRRNVPVFHPQNNWLWARAITKVDYLKATGKDISSWDHAVSFAVYTHALITTEFCDVRYEVLRDDEVIENPDDPDKGFAEWTRYVEQIPQPYTEMVRIDGGQMLAVTPTYSTVDKTPKISAPYMLAIMRKSAFNLIWREVPAELLFNDEGLGLAPKLVGTEKTIELSLFSDQPTEAWDVAAIDLMPNLGMPTTLEFFFDKDTGSRGKNGDKLRLTIKAVAKSIYGASAFSVISQLDGRTFLWMGLVAN